MKGVVLDAKIDGKVRRAGDGITISINGTIRYLNGEKEDNLSVKTPILGNRKDLAEDGFIHVQGDILFVGEKQDINYIVSMSNNK